MRKHFYIFFQFSLLYGVELEHFEVRRRQGFWELSARRERESMVLVKLSWDFLKYVKEQEMV